MSTARSATSIDMSVSVRSMPTIELWQYWQPWLQRWVSTKACSVGPVEQVLLLAPPALGLGVEVDLAGDEVGAP